MIEYQLEHLFNSAPDVGTAMESSKLGLGIRLTCEK
jgi:hypothetical protein